MTSQPIEYPDDPNDGGGNAWWARSAGADPAGDPASPRAAIRPASQEPPYRPDHRPPPARPGGTATARQRARQYQSNDALRLALQGERARLRAHRLESEQREATLVGQLDEIATRLGHVEALLANGPDAGPPAALRSIGSPPPAEAAA